MKPLVGTESSRIVHALILICYWVVLTWPALSSGYIPSRDVLIHLLWSTNFTNQLWAGDLYPRWLGEMNGGLGSPVFFFYGPLPYYFTALLKPLFHADPEGWHQLGVAASLAVGLSGLSVYAWAKRSFGDIAALVSSIVYMGAPYHLAWDLYQRFAFAELWAFVWMPLVLCCIDGIIKGSRKSFIGLVFAYAGLALTHLPTLMIFTPVALAYSAYFASRETRLRIALITINAMALGTGLAAFYLVPAMTTQANISLADMRGGMWAYTYHFLYYGPRHNEDFANMLIVQGRYAAVMILACLTAFFSLRQSGGAAAKGGNFWLIIAIIVFAMMLPIARPIWDHLPLLQAIQFPWRFNALLTLAMVSFLTLWVASISAKSAWLKRLILIIVCGVVISQSFPTIATYLALSTSPGEASMNKLMSQFGSLKASVNEKIHKAELSMDTPEYRPRWVEREFYGNSAALKRLLAEVATSSQQHSSVAVVSHAPRRIVVVVDTAIGEWVKMPLFYYPGWRAFSDGSSEPLPLRPSNPEGLIEIEPGHGKHNIVLELVPSIPEIVGWIVSGASLLLLGMLTFWSYHKKSLSGEADARAN